VTTSLRRRLVSLGAIALLAAGCGTDDSLPTVNADSPPGDISYLASRVGSGLDSPALIATVVTKAGREYQIDPVYDGSGFGHVVLAPSGGFAAVLGAADPDSQSRLRILRFDTGQYVDLDGARGCDVAGTVLIAPDSKFLLHAACGQVRRFAWREGAWVAEGDFTIGPDAVPLAVSQTGLLLSVENAELIVRNTPTGNRLRTVQGIERPDSSDLADASAIFTPGDEAFLVMPGSLYAVDARKGIVTESKAYTVPPQFSEVSPTIIGTAQDTAAWSFFADGRLQVWQAVADAPPQTVLSTDSDVIDLQVASSVMLGTLNETELNDLMS
jgi:hypothetical protein